MQVNNVNQTSFLLGWFKMVAFIAICAAMNGCKTTVPTVDNFKSYKLHAVFSDTDAPHKSTISIYENPSANRILNFDKKKFTSLHKVQGLDFPLEISVDDINQKCVNKFGFNKSQFLKMLSTKSFFLEKVIKIEIFIVHEQNFRVEYPIKSAAKFFYSIPDCYSKQQYLDDIYEILQNVYHEAAHIRMEKERTIEEYLSSKTSRCAMFYSKAFKQFTLPKIVHENTSFSKLQNYASEFNDAISLSILGNLRVDYELKEISDKGKISRLQIQNNTAISNKLYEYCDFKI